MANTTIQINTNPTSDPQYAGGSVVLPPADSVIDITPINENAQALTKAVNQLFWDVNQGGGGTDAQIDINRQNIGAASGQLLPVNLQTQINNTNTNLNNLANVVGDVGSGLVKAVADNTSDISTNASNITAVNGRVDTTNSNVSANTTQIGNIKSAVGIDNSGQLTPTVAGTLAKQVADNATAIQNTAASIGNPTDASTDPTVYGYANSVKDIANSNTTVLEVLGGGVLPTTSISTQIQNELASYTPVVGANSVDTAAIQDDAVTSAKILDGSITTSKLNSGAVTSAKIGNKEVKTANIDDGAVTNTQLAANSVDTGNIVNGCVTSDKMGTDVDVVTIRSFYSTTVTVSSNTYQVNIKYTNYLSGYCEVCLSGTQTSGTFTPNQTVADITMLLSLFGISIGSSAYSSAHIDSAEFVVGASGNHTYDVCSNYSELVFNGSAWELQTHLSGLDNSQTYSIKQFRVTLGGSGITFTQPSP